MAKSKENLLCYPILLTVILALLAANAVQGAGVIATVTVGNIPGAWLMILHWARYS